MVYYRKNPLMAMAVAAGLMVGGNAAQALEQEKLTLSFEGTIQSFNQVGMGLNFMLGMKLPCPHMKGTIQVDLVKMLPPSEERPYYDWEATSDQNIGRMSIDTTREQLVEVTKDMPAQKSLVERLGNVLQIALREVCSFPKDTSDGYRKAEVKVVVGSVSEDHSPPLVLCSQGGDGALGVSGDLQIHNLDGSVERSRNGIEDLRVDISLNEIRVKELIGGGAPDLGGWRSTVDRALSAACDRPVHVNPRVQARSVAASGPNQN